MRTWNALIIVGSCFIGTSLAFSIAKLFIKGLDAYNFDIYFNQLSIWCYLLAKEVKINGKL
jgi:hypothetical protein